MTCPARTLDGERCTVGRDPCPVHGQWAQAVPDQAPQRLPVDSPPPGPTKRRRGAPRATQAAILADERVARARQITATLARDVELGEERRRILVELMADGSIPVSQLADAIGIARQRLYAITKEDR